MPRCSQFGTRSTLINGGVTAAMKLFHILITGISVFSLISAHAESEDSLEDPLVSGSDLSFFDEQTDELDKEILSLEEELKEDAESLEETIATDLEENAYNETFSYRDNTEEVSAASNSLITTDEGETASFTSTAQEEKTTQLMTTEESPALPIETQLNHETSPIKIIDFPSDPLNTENKASLETAPPKPYLEINLQHAFAGSPYLYSLLGIMSIVAVGIWLYSLISLRTSVAPSQAFLRDLQNKLNSNQFEDALNLCTTHRNVFSKMIATGIGSRRHGLPVMIEVMKGEGKRASVQLWQRIGLLNDIAIIAPMLGLLGTVLGMFYAFYDINRSTESISTLFDGLGVSVGTTVAGLVVAILALILHSTIKYRLVKTLANVENEAQLFANLIDDRTSVYKV
jgi:biopolymer transport protein ExbB